MSFVVLIVFVCTLLFPPLKQMKKKLVGLTREHEALFNFVKNNTHICTEKEKQKVQYGYCTIFHYYIQLGP